MNKRTIPVTVETVVRRLPVVYDSPEPPATKSPGALAIRKHRNRRGLSVAECARRAEVNQRTWRRWEDGTRTMPADLWRAVQDW